MKTIKLLINAICVSVFTLFLLGAACGVPVDTSDSYYIKFKVDGVQKNYDKGLTDVEEKPFGIQWPEDGTEIWANPNVVSNGDQIEWLYIMTFLLDVGTESTDGTVEYVTEARAIIYRSTSYTVTITTYGSVGGIIEGTFSATVENFFPPNDLKEITEGEFRVKRIADNTNLW
jgi:hypothetical protein